MAKKLDEILVIDIESTCWKGASPEGQVSEIIEIGICVLDVKTLERTSKESILVKPVQSQISEFCTELTTITPAMVEKNGVDLKEACKILHTKYESQQRLWGSWGDYDRRQFQQNCSQRKIGYPFGTSHLNFKTLFALKHRLEREQGMGAALQMMGWPLEGVHHRGVDDAWNIARLASMLI